MRKYLIAGLLAAAVSAAAIGAAAANDTRIRVYNFTNRAMVSLRVAHVTGDSWSGNLLDEAIQPGESRVVDVDDEGLNWCRFRLHGGFKGDFTADNSDFNACELDGWRIWPPRRLSNND